MISVGEDRSLFIWDVEKNKLLQRRFLQSFSSSSLSKSVSCIKFSPNGNVLVLGFFDGTIMFLDSKITKTMHGKTEERYQPPSLDIINNFKQDSSKVSVLDIEFSRTGEYVAVSYDNKQERFDTIQQSEGSFITIYVNKSKGRKEPLLEKSSYSKHSDIKGQQSQQQYSTNKQRYSLSACFMSFVEEQEKHILVIYYQLVDQMFIRVNDPKTSELVIWDISTNTGIKSLETIKSVNWHSLNFPNSINAKYLVDPRQKEEKQGALTVSYMAAMALFDPGTLVLGSVNGDLHLLKSAGLDLGPLQVQELPNEEFALAKTYSAHISFVNQVCSHEQHLFSTGINDECIFKWKVELEHLPSEFDNYAQGVETKDIYGEIRPYWDYRRDSVVDMIAGEDGRSALRLLRIIGRRAADRRNTLRFDRKARVLYILGCNLVIKDFQIGTPKFTLNAAQTVLQLDFSELSAQAELSCFIQNKARTLLVAGTAEKSHCKIVTWDIYSKSLLQSITIPICSTILFLAISDNDEYVAFVALTELHELFIGLADLRLRQVLGSCRFLHSSPCKIRDVLFLPGSKLKFLTCGVQHLAVWTLKGQKLIYESCRLLKVG